MTTPFNEATKVRKTIAVNDRVKPVDDRFRNGVEILGDIHVMRGSWQTTAGRFETLGELSSESSGSFTDAIKFDHAFSVVSPKTALIRTRVDDESLFGDGFIEPLTLRDEISRTTIDSPFIFHSVKGQLMGGTENILLRTVEIEQFVEYTHNSAEPFVESGRDFGDNQSGKNTSYQLQVYRQERSGSAFNELNYIHNGARVSQNFDSGILSGVLAMKPSSHDMLPNGKKSSAAGFVIDEGIFGTDSITFLR